MHNVRYLDEQSLRDDRAPRLLRYLLAHGADEFSITVMALQDTPAPFVDAFEDELGPYERQPAAREALTRGADRRATRTVRLWTFNESSLARLLSFLDSGVFRSPAGPDGWFEDLTIYRRGELILGVVSHTLEGELRLTPLEHAAVRQFDIPSWPTADGRDR